MHVSVYLWGTGIGDGVGDLTVGGGFSELPARENLKNLFC